MGFFTPTFKDLTMKNEYMTAHIGFSVFNGRFRRAQERLDREIMNKMTPYIPYKTGKFLSRIQANNRGFEGTGTIRVAVPPQGRKLYPGISKSGKPFNWTNPMTQPRWGSYTVERYKTELKQGVKDVILGRK